MMRSLMIVCSRLLEMEISVIRFSLGLAAQAWIMAIESDLAT